MIKFIAGAALATGLTATPAAAAIIVATFYGTVSSGIDYTGEFAAPGTDLSGQTFVAKYVYDTALGNVLGTASRQQLYGGSYYASVDPVRSITVTVGGVERTIDGNLYGGVLITTDNGGAFSVSGGERSNGGATTNEIDSLIVSDPAIPASFTTPFYTSKAIGYGEQDVQFLTTSGGGYSHDATVQGDVTRLSVAAVVPEPAAWATMLAGFAAVGTAARRRRRAALG